MTWADEANELTHNPTHPFRRTRQKYIPPSLRQTCKSNCVTNLNSTRPPSFNFSTESAPSFNYSSFNSHQLRGSSPPLGRGRGRGRNSYGAASNPNQNSTSYNITNKFEQLELKQDDDSTDNNNVNAINFDAYEDIPVQASGSEIPEPVASFDEIDLGEALSQNIKRCKYVKPTPVQRHAIPIAVAGRDLMACAQTGSGKTAAFCFPIICGILRDRFKQVRTGGGGFRVAYPSALILSPTRELSCQIHEEATKFAYKTGLKVAVAYGGALIAEQFRNLEKGVDILVATPGRLVDMIQKAGVSLKMIKYLALDEADRMLDMGFEQQIRKIVEQMGMPPPGSRQTMLFSATFPDDIQRLASDFLSNYIFLTVGKVGSSTDLIAQRIELVQDMDKRSRLMNLLCAQKTNGQPALTLVFVETKRGADALEHWLCMNGLPAIAIHGDKVQRERERALRSFKSAMTPILVATDVASRGLDIPCVAHVINFDMPKGIDVYVHRIGRTGRAGNSGLATAFFSDKNLPLAKPLVDLMHEAKQEVPSWLSKYAENSSGGSGRASRYGRSKFSGSDFRTRLQIWGDNYQRPGTNDDENSVIDAQDAASSEVGYTAPAPASTEYYATAYADYHALADVDSYATGSREYGDGHESIVASGWDQA